MGLHQSGPKYSYPKTNVYNPFGGGRHIYESLTQLCLYEYHLGHLSFEKDHQLINMVTGDVIYPGIRMEEN